MKRRLASLLATVRQDRVSARALVLSDLRSFTRTCFLASVVDSGLHRRLGSPISRPDLARALHVVQDDRFDAWIDLGVSLKELSERNGLLSAKGRRLRSLTDSDTNIIGSYRAALQSEAPMYNDIIPLLTTKVDHAPSWLL